MKKCLFILALLALLSPAAKAQPPIGYIGLFTDDAHSSWCAYGTTPYYLVNMYIWCLPGADGQKNAEFAIDYTNDAGIIKTAATANSHISVTLGSLDTGMSVGLNPCQTTWHWIFRQPLYINTSSKRTIQIIAHPDPNINAYQFTNCLPGYPIVPCIVFTNLYINSQNGIDPECMTTGTESSSWGAIKKLYEN